MDGFPDGRASQIPPPGQTSQAPSLPHSHAHPRPTAPQAGLTPPEPSGGQAHRGEGLGLGFRGGGRGAQWDQRPSASLRGPRPGAAQHKQGCPGKLTGVQRPGFRRVGHVGTQHPHSSPDMRRLRVQKWPRPARRKGHPGPGMKARQPGWSMSRLLGTRGLHTRRPHPGPSGDPSLDSTGGMENLLSLGGGSGAGSQPAGRGRVCRFQSGCKYSRPVFRLLAGRYAPPCAPGTGQTLGGTQPGPGGLHTPGHGGGRGFWPRSQVRLLRRLWGFNCRAGRGSAPGNGDRWTGPLQGWPGGSAVSVGRLGAMLCREPRGVWAEKTRTGWHLWQVSITTQTGAPRIHKGLSPGGRLS